jgi:hypothetical protein
MEAPEARLETDGVVCPWCRRETPHGRCWDEEEGERECEGCGRQYLMERRINPAYSTWPLVRCPDCGQPVKLRAGGVLAQHYLTVDLPGAPCGMSKQPYRGDLAGEGGSRP